jgi:hypothetical protein
VAAYFGEGQKQEGTASRGVPDSEDAQAPLTGPQESRDLPMRRPSKLPLLLGQDHNRLEHGGDASGGQGRPQDRQARDPRVDSVLLGRGQQVHPVLLPWREVTDETCTITTIARKDVPLDITRRRL